MSAVACHFDSHVYDFNNLYRFHWCNTQIVKVVLDLSMQLCMQYAVNIFIKTKYVRNRTGSRNI